MSWIENKNHLYLKVSFKTTEDALNFIRKVSHLADLENHHPKIIFMYLTVSLYLQTHDNGNIITSKDYDLAKKISSIL